ncbi:MAG: methionyl-tRNA formyltransferase [Gammaproteobacteria bacterium]
MRIENPRIVFAGTPDFAVPALRRLIDTGHRVAAVYTQPDRPAGRGRQPRPSPVKSLASECGIEVRQPASLRDDEAQAELRALHPDLLIVAAYGLILPQGVLDIPTHGCWNIHASLLPRWRGAAPIQRALEAGDRETGVCIMRMEAGLDTGPVYRSRATPIGPDDTGGSVHDRLAVIGADLLLECLGLAARGELPEPQAQPDSGVEYAPKLTKGEAELDWSRSAVELERQVRAFNPWPVAWFRLDGARLRVWSAAVESGDASVAPGQVLDAGPRGIVISAGDGALRLVEVQAEGGRRIAAGDYANAHPELAHSARGGA